MDKSELAQEIQEDKNGKNIHYLPVHTNMTPEDARASTEQFEWRELLFVGHDEEGNLRIRASKMKSRDALWLLECAKQRVMAHITKMELEDEE